MHSETQSTNAANLVGGVVGDRYRVEAIIARGGMGTVYRARHVRLDTQVALKILHSSLLDDPQYMERFLREARVTSHLRHPNLAQTLDFGQLPSGIPYLAMEYLEGQTLTQYLRASGPLDWASARGLVRQIVQGLGAAHQHGVVHRDVKPGNIILVPDTTSPGELIAKVVDFGIAKTAHQDGGERLTSSNMLMGTAVYMAPEQALSREVDARTDVYAVGVVLYRMLAGDVPFRGDSLFEILAQQISVAPKPLREVVGDVPVAVDALVLKALAKDPAARFPTMAELDTAIGRAWDAMPNPATVVAIRPRRNVNCPLIVAGTALVAVLVAVFAAAAWSMRVPDDSAITSADGVPPTLLDSKEAIAPRTDTGGEEDHAGGGPATSVDRPGFKPDAGEVADSDAADSESGLTSGSTGSAPAPTNEPAAESAFPSASDDLRSAPRLKKKPPYQRRNTRRNTAPAPSDATVIAQLKSKIHSRCKALKSGTRLELRFSILSSGETSVPRVRPPHDGSPLGKCAILAVRAAKFPAGGLRVKKLVVDL